MSDPKHRIQRILTLIPYLRKHPGVSVEELSQFSGVPASEILSDLDRILLCGVPPYLPDDYIGVYVEDGRVEIRFADHFRRPVRFTLTEALALRLAIESLPEGGDPAYEEARGSLMDRLDEILGHANPGAYAGRKAGDPATQVRATSGMGPAFGVPPWRQHIRSVLEVLLPAVGTKHAVEIAYYSASSDATAPRVVHPYGFVDKSGEHYLVAYCTKSQEVRTFRVDRLRSAQQLDEQFTQARGFSLSRFERQAMNFTTSATLWARIKLSGDEVRWVREQFSEDALEHCIDGSIVVHLQALSMTWLLNEILRFGTHVEVLEPDEIRLALHDHLAAMRAIHQQPALA